jgi:DNA-directed RNA polymerase subunit H (RpoH/RPB5)
MIGYYAATAVFGDEDDVPVGISRSSKTADEKVMYLVLMLIAAI